MGIFNKLGGKKKEINTFVEKETLVLDESEKVRELLVKALGDAGDIFIMGLNDKDLLVRNNAAKCVAKILGPKGINILILLLKDKSENLRDGVTKALVEIGDPAVEMLIQFLGSDSHLIRYGAADALGGIKDCRAVEPLIQTLKDEDKDVRRISAWALGRIGERKAVGPLIQTLKDNEENVRRVAIWSFGEIGDASVVESLTQALNDDSKDIRKVAKEAIEKIKERKRFFATLK